MLQAIRDRAQGWIAWAIVILISIPFALWGIQEYLGVGSAPVVATVNGTEITEQELDRNYQQFRRNLRERLGTAYRAEFFDDVQLRKQVLNDMIRNELIRQKSEKLGLYAGDQLVRAAILSVPQFRKEGRFDQATYEQVLGYQGLSPAAFEHRIRSSLISGQLDQALNLSEFVTRYELETRLRLREQKRRISYFVLPIEEFENSEPIPEKEIDAYYNAQKTLFQIPEQVRLEYLELNAELIAANVKPDEETLRGYYQTHQEEYGEPEQRQASHILVTVASDADEVAVQAAREKIDAALSRIQQGEQFEEVAKQVSEDPSSAELGGDLGLFTKGIMDPAFEQAAFEAQVGEVVGPIRSRFGFHIIKVTRIQDSSAPSFEAKRGELLADYQRNEAQRIFYDYAERVSELAYENPDSLKPAAESLDIATQTSDWMGREGGPGVLATPKVVSAAFSEEVLRQGYNSEAIELGPEHILVLRVVEHEESSVKPLSEVREQVIANLRRKAAAKQAHEKGMALLKRLQANEKLEVVAAETGYSVTAIDALRRDNQELPHSLVADAFRLVKPEGQKPTFGTSVLPDQDVAVVALYEVVEGSLSDLEPERMEQEKSALRQDKGETIFNHLVQQMRNDADVTIR